MLRNALILSATIVVLLVGLRVWTAGPDTVRVIVTHHVDNGTAVATGTTVYDRTVHDAALAQRFQRDLAALPIVSPFDHFSCPEMLLTYDTYALEWSRSGLFVERAIADTTGCHFWMEDGVIVRLPRSDVIYTDLHAALGTPLPPGV